MFSDFKQFVPQAVCLACDGCCRFLEEGSPWRPRLSEEETKTAPGEAPGPAAREVDGRGYIRAVPFGENYRCLFLEPAGNACRIYSSRPFECRFYPFLLIKKEGKAMVGAHLNCPYIQQKKGTLEWSAYLEYLEKYLHRRDVRDFIRSGWPQWGGEPGEQNECETLFPLKLSGPADK
ncbi:MAG: YkgJ family cysteine cluster protein [Candidatus Omnitrophota bacterium]